MKEENNNKIVNRRPSRFFSPFECGILPWFEWGEEMTKLLNSFDHRAFKDSLSFSSDGRENSFGHMLELDAFECNNEFILNCNVPGLKKENIELSIDESGQYLTIQVQASYEHMVEKPCFIKRERSLGSQVRNFKLPNNINVNEITAKVEDGVLQIRAPLIQEALPKTKTSIPIQ